MFAIVHFPERITSHLILSCHIIFSHSRLAIGVLEVNDTSKSWNDTNTQYTVLTRMCFARNDNYQLAGFSLYNVILVIMCAQYVRILQVVIRQIRDIAKNTPQFRNSPEPRDKPTNNRSPTMNTRSSFTCEPNISPGRDRNGNHLAPVERKRSSRASRGSTDGRASRGSTDGLLNRIRYSTDVNKKRWSTIALKIRDFRKELKATKTIALVFLAFCLCWLPGSIFTYIHAFSPNTIQEMSAQTKNIIFFTLLDIFPMVNTMINPIIYSFSNTQFRNAVEDIWRKMHGKSPKRGSIFVSSSASRPLSTIMDTTNNGKSARQHLLSPPV